MPSWCRYRTAPEPRPSLCADASASWLSRVSSGLLRRALPPDEQRGFLEAGFNVHEHLHLLALDRDVTLPPVPPGPALRRAGALRRKGVLEVDAAAFAPFWRLDRAGLRDALGATQQRHLRVVLGVRHKVVGYAICGASDGRGFVQRLAVMPEAQGHGLGKRLLLDGLHWLRGLNAHRIVVNTQIGNDAALGLYQQVGFREDPAGLSVLSAPLYAPLDGPTDGHGACLLNRPIRGQPVHVGPDGAPRGRVAASDGYRCGWLRADGRHRRQRKRGAQAGLYVRNVKRRSPTGEQPGATDRPRSNRRRPRPTWRPGRTACSSSLRPRGSTPARRSSGCTLRSRR